MKTRVVDPKKNNIVVSTRNKHVDPKGKEKVDDEGFTKIKDTRKSSRRPSYVAPRRQMKNTFKNSNSFAPQFYGYCFKCNAYGHRVSDYRLINRPPPN